MIKEKLIKQAQGAAQSAARGIPRAVPSAAAAQQTAGVLGAAGRQAAVPAMMGLLGPLGGMLTPLAQGAAGAAARSTAPRYSVDDLAQLSESAYYSSPAQRIGRISPTAQMLVNPALAGRTVAPAVGRALKSTANVLNPISAARWWGRKLGL